MNAPTNNGAQPATTAAAVFDLLRSLNAACVAASVEPPTIEALGNMQALDLLAMLAPNGVRFCYNPPRVVKS